MTEEVTELSDALVRWMRRRRQSAQWVYHPRKTEVSHFVREKVLGDLLTLSSAFATEARAGKLTCDLNVRLENASGRGRKLDLVVGPPLAPVPPTDDAHPLRKAKVSTPLLTLETKLCMTEHRKATSRLIDELHASLDAVKAANPTGICVAVVVINVAERFTSPLNLPGPNLHDRPEEIHRLARRIFERVPVGTQHGYDDLAMALLDTDNETRFEVGAGIAIPNERTYPSFVRRTRTLLDDRITALA